MLSSVKLSSDTCKYKYIGDQPPQHFFFSTGLLVSDYKFIFWLFSGIVPTFIPGGYSYPKITYFLISIAPFYIFYNKLYAFFLKAYSTWYAVFADTYIKVRPLSFAKRAPSSYDTFRLRYFT